MRTHGVDLGRVRIGLALADEVLRTAQALTTLTRRDEKHDLAAITAIASDYEVSRAVLGLPLNMDGSEGASARHARAFAPKLAAALGAPVELFDERLTSKEAERALSASGKRQREQRGQVDRVAATLLLHAFLDLRSRRERQGGEP